MTFSLNYPLLYFCSLLSYPLFYNSPDSLELTSCLTPYTEGIKKVSFKENFGKILKVSHFHLSFSLNKNNKEIKYFQRVLLDFSRPRPGELMKYYMGLKTLMKHCGNVHFVMVFIL